MNDWVKFSWAVEAAKPSKWGKVSTKEEKEDLKKEKHTPGKKKKRGRSQITVEPSPGRYAGRSKPGTAEEKGRRCGKSYIAKEDECHVNDSDLPKPRPAPKAKPPKKPRTKTVKPKDRTPGVSKLPETPHVGRGDDNLPPVVNSPEGGEGELIGEGYLQNGEDGLYDMGEGANRLHRIYFPKDEGQAKAQYLCSAIASIMGLASPDDYLFRNSPIDERVGVGHPVVPFSELDEMMLRRLAKTTPEVAGWFIHAVLVRHQNVIGPNFENMVLRKDGRVSVLRMGGTLLWNDGGGRKPDGMSPNDLVELESLRSPEANWSAAAVFGSFSDQEIASAVTNYLGHLEDKYILDLVDAASFDPEDRKEIGKGLIFRKHLLEDLAGEDNDIQ